MSIDVSKVVHICPICDDEFGSHNKVRKHVTNREDEQHRGINGFNMDMTIVTEEKDVWDVESEQALHNKIATASEYFDNISNEEIREIADKAEVPVSRVIRVFNDEGISYNTYDMKPTTSISGLTPKQYAVLEEWNGKNDTRSTRSIGAEVNRKNQDIEISESYPSHVIRKYGWMKLPIYDGSEFKREHTDGGDITVENTTGDMLDTTSAYLNPDNESDNTNEQNNESDSDTITQEDVYEAFLDSDVEFTVVPDEDEFDVMSKLIKSGHDEVARHIFE
jgi:hypothetical protein